METIEDIVQASIEKSSNQGKSKKERRKKKWKKIRYIVFFLILCFGVFYFISDYAKVKRLYVTGNRFYDTNEVLSIANLSYETRYALTPGFYIKWKLERDPLIQEANVTVDWNGTIAIQVVEETIFGYIVNNDGQAFAILKDGKKHEIQKDQLESIVHYPLISGLSDENLALLATSFMNAENPIKDKYLSMISEIRPYATSYDANMLQLVMQDGNVIYTSYAGLGLLNYYTSVLERLNSTHVCLIVQESTNSIISTECPSQG